MDLIGVKIGSSLLTDDHGVNKEYLLDLCRQIYELKKFFDQRVFLVTSGAVASEQYAGFSDNLRAAIGQGALIGEYRRFFNIFGIKVAQFLVTDADLDKSVADPIALKTIKEATWFVHDVVPVINANDVVSDKELKELSVCADNDRLSQLVCERLQANMMIIGIDKDGLKNDVGEIVGQVSSSDSLERLLSFVNDGGKGYGYGGMKTKIFVAYELMKAGVKVVLAPGREKDFILRAFHGEENFGTIFSP